MDEAVLKALLELAGLPVAYHHFDSHIRPPYIVYLVVDAAAWGSDERNGIKRTGYLVELYTLKRDPALQASLETLFNERGISYRISEGFIKSEGLYQAAYAISFTKKIRRI